MMKMLASVQCFLVHNHKNANRYPMHSMSSSPLASAVAALSHTCDETVLPGDGGQVVAVDVALKLKDFSRLKNDKVRQREGQLSVCSEYTEKQS